MHYNFCLRVFLFLELDGKREILLSLRHRQSEFVVLSECVSEEMCERYKQYHMLSLLCGVYTNITPLLPSLNRLITIYYKYLICIHKT